MLGACGAARPTPIAPDGDLQTLRRTAVPIRPKNSPVIIPWLNIWITAPLNAIRFSAATPNSTNPQWLTDE